LLLEVARLDELTEDESADDIEEAEGEKEEDTVEPEALDGGRRKDARVGRFLHGVSAAGGTPIRSMTAFWVRATGRSAKAPAMPATSSCRQSCQSVSAEAPGAT
jgi:hypothetical protein